MENSILIGLHKANDKKSLYIDKSANLVSKSGSYIYGLAISKLLHMHTNTDPRSKSTVYNRIITDEKKLD